MLNYTPWWKGWLAHISVMEHPLDCVCVYLCGCKCIVYDLSSLFCRKRCCSFSAEICSWLTDLPAVIVLWYKFLWLSLLGQYLRAQCDLWPWTFSVLSATYFYSFQYSVRRTSRFFFFFILVSDIVDSKYSSMLQVCWQSSDNLNMDVINAKNL